MARAQAATYGAIELGMRRGVLAGQSIVRGKASGRPGPRVITGDYRRSIVGEVARAGASFFGQIGTNAAQGLRLENGFHGPDSINRFYNQPAFPHFGPSVPEVRIAMVTNIGAALKAGLG
jgi:hypothetical protein